MLGDDANEAIAWFGATERGNFEGENILVRGDRPEPARLPEWRRRLYEVRAQRVWPGLDDKRLTAWNALAISALADAGAAFAREDYLDAARRAAGVRARRSCARTARAAFCAPGRTGAGA